MRTEVLVVGAGLSGLHTAAELARQGVDFLLVEARDRIGGRILSRSVSKRGVEPSGAKFDLGPTWFWPGQQRIESLIRRLGLAAEVFDQFDRGAALYEDPAGSVRRGVEGVSMTGSYRLKGGLARLTHGLAQELPPARLRCGVRVKELALDDAGDRGVRATVRVGARSEHIDCRQVVLALPPRLVATGLHFTPALPASSRAELLAVPTWMAGQAKLVAIYPRPFWRDQGLSGDAISHFGPLQEIHDMSPAGAAPYALFGFLGVPASARRQQRDALREASVAQLIRLFGAEAAQPLEVLFKDWAFDSLTSTVADHQLEPHPMAVDLSPSAGMLWDGRVHLSGAETANAGARNNGYLEGALEASERTLRKLRRSGSVD